MRKGTKHTAEAKARVRLAQQRRWDAYHANPTSPEALAYREKVSATQKARHARYNVIMALLQG